MRIIAGKWRGRPLKTLPGAATRPTLDRVKETLFNLIGPYFDGGTALDAFAGSGALGLEALSRGAERAVLVERNSRALAVIRENVRSLGAEAAVRLLCLDARRLPEVLPAEGIAADLAFFDPPYGWSDAALAALILKLAASGVFRPGATIAVERGGPFSALPDEAPAAGGVLRRLKRRTVGVATLEIWRFDRNPAG